MGSAGRRWFIALTLSAALTLAGSVPPARAEVTRTEVEKAIRDGVHSLKGSQQADGSWGGQHGTTELVTLGVC